MLACLFQGGDKQYELEKKDKSDICTIMYTSGTTGEPKGVLISNESIITLIAGVDRFLESANEQVKVDSCAVFVIAHQQNLKCFVMLIPGFSMYFIL